MKSRALLFAVAVCCVCAYAHGAIVPVSDEKRDIIDHDVVTFRFNAGTNCVHMLARTITRVGGWQPGFEQDVSGNCYIQNSRIYLEIFLDVQWTSYLWVDFTDTVLSDQTPVVTFDALSDGSLAVTQHRQPYYTATSEGSFHWNVCTDQAKNQWWVRHEDLVGIDYQGCLDNACGGTVGDLYTAYQKCSAELGQVSWRTCASALDAGIWQMQETVFWIENVNGNQWTAGQTFTADCNGAMTELNVVISDVNTAGTVQVDLLSGSGWAADTAGEFTQTFSVDAPGTYKVLIDFEVAPGDVFTVRLSVPTTDNTWVGFTLVQDNYAGGAAIRSNDGRLASPALETDYDFAWSVRSPTVHDTPSGGQDAWALCSSSKGDAMLVARQQQAIPLDKHGVPQGDWFDVASYGPDQAWQVKCHVSEDGNTALTVWTQFGGASNCYLNVFARDGSSATQSMHLSPYCVAPQAVHNTFDEEILALFSGSTGGLFVHVAGFKDGVLTEGFATPVAPGDTSARRGSIARSNAYRRTAACWIGAVDDVSCQLFVDPKLKKMGSPFQANSNATVNSGDVVLMDASESGLFMVGWKSGSNMYVTAFDLWGTIIYREVLIGPIGTYFDSSGFMSIRNDGVALVGREDTQYTLTVLNADGSMRGAETTFASSTNQGPAVELYDDGSALVSYERAQSTYWGSLKIPCPQ